MDDIETQVKPAIQKIGAAFKTRLEERSKILPLETFRLSDDLKVLG